MRRTSTEAVRSAAPLHHEQRRVIRGVSAPRPLERVGQGTGHRPDPAAGPLQMVHTVDQPVLPELLPAGLVLLDHSIGEAEDAVPALQHQFADPRL